MSDTRPTEVRFRQALTTLAPPRSAHLRVALSGGSDSVALLDLLVVWCARHRRDLAISAGHLDHALRPDSGEDARTAADVADRLGVPLVATREDVVALARGRRVSAETAGRIARLARYRAWVEEDGVHAVLTAHHRDDQVETILARILRGTGLRGLTGIPLRRPIEDGLPGELWRPCLGITRAELSAHRTARGLPAHEDPSNRSLDPTRNRIRAELLPTLREAFNPAIDEALVALAERAREVERTRAGAIERVRAVCLVRGPHAAVPRDAVAALAEDPGTLAGLLDRLWSESRGTPAGLDRSHHELWGHLATGGGRGGPGALPDGATIERAGGGLLLLGGAAAPGAPPPSTPLPENGTVSLRGATVHCGGTTPEGSDDESIAASLPARPLLLRGARSGDLLRSGATKSRVDELLRAAGVPSRFRPEFPVVADAGDDTVLWLPGIRPALESGPRPVRCHPEPGPDPIAFLLWVAARNSETV